MQSRLTFQCQRLAPASPPPLRTLRVRHRRRSFSRRLPRRSQRQLTAAKPKPADDDRYAIPAKTDDTAASFTIRGK